MFLKIMVVLSTIQLRVWGFCPRGFCPRGFCPRRGLSVPCFRKILFQHGKKFYMSFLCFYTYSLCKTKAQTAVLMDLVVKKYRHIRGTLYLTF